MTADLTLRRTEPEDCRFLFDLRNEESVRRNSFHSEVIPYQQHKQWFEKKIVQPEARMYILMHGEERIGQVRVDIEKQAAEISYALCKEARGHGYAKWMLRKLEELLKQEGCCQSLIAEVKYENLASRKIFQALGYEEKEAEAACFYRKDME